MVSDLEDVPGRFMIRIERRPIDIDSAHFHLADLACGAASVFVGTVRADQTAHGVVSALEYEAYERLARKTMLQIAVEAAERFGVRRAVMLHRVGRLEPGEVAVCCGAATPHRADAIAGCEYLVDELKTRVPIWKREWTGDTSRWIACDIRRASEAPADYAPNPSEIGSAAAAAGAR